MNVSDILQVLDKIAPFALALDWDNSGLQTGDPDAPVKWAAVSLDPSLESVKAALDGGAQLLITHHPLIFSPLKSLNTGDPRAAALLAAIKGGLAVVAFHTNYDAAVMSLALAERLELRPEGFLEAAPLNLLKLVVLVPEDVSQKVMDAVFAAGAGDLGDYSQCSFSSPGVGSFLPGDDALPYAGEPGIFTRCRELRIEALLPPSRREAVTKALRRAHPYEEPAFEFYPATLSGRYGFGLVGSWNEPRDPAAFVRERLGLEHLPLAWNAPGEVTRAALLPGSGGAYLEAAKKAGAEILVTGELGHHRALEALDLGLGVLSAGHFETENPGMESLALRLERLLAPEVRVFFIAGRSPFARRTPRG
ncbi:MAG: Nif3-like dinuclear metal center hexameric protein [Deltaproteobacteria bacterium]|jgi:dinuclear metal center YbgI/SA1388 family protein|nr:Nif3-like dinuclear metal center hexameric protein [Deltaproteobacteria bacterium]